MSYDLHVYFPVAVLVTFGQPAFVVVPLNEPALCEPPGQLSGAKW